MGFLPVSGCRGRLCFLWPLGPLFFLAVALHYSSKVPVHFDSDNFNYLNAAREGTGYVGLVMGRTLYCWMGQCFFKLSQMASMDPLFGGFRLWVVSTQFVQALLLFAAGLAVARRMGLAAAHVFLAALATRTGLTILFLGVWPENWAMILMITACLVMTSRSLGVPARLGLGLFAAILMGLMKEVAIYYVPALALLAFLALPEIPRLKRVALTGAWAVLAAFVPMFITVSVLPRLLPGLAEAQAAATAATLSSVSPDLNAWGRFARNACWLWQPAVKSPIFYALAVAGFLRSGIGLARGTISRRSLAIFLFALALTVVPMTVICALAARVAMSRYMTTVAPGLALMGALFLANPLPSWLALPRCRASLAALICLAMVCFADRKDLRHHHVQGRIDQKRYKEMLKLQDTPLSVFGYMDSWPALYINRASAPPGGKVRWDMRFHNWRSPTEQNGYSPTREWAESNLARGVGLAISSTADSRLGHLPKFLRRRFPDLKFQRHASGWWICLPKKPRPSSPAPAVSSPRP